MKIGTEEGGRAEVDEAMLRTRGRVAAAEHLMQRRVTVPIILDCARKMISA